MKTANWVIIIMIIILPIGVFNFTQASYEINGDNVYFLKNIVDGADSNTFEIILDPYAKDKNNVYCNGAKIENVDISTIDIFEVGGDHDYSLIRDKNNIYSCLELISNDPDNFVYIGSIYYMDRYNVYTIMDFANIEGADSGTFEVFADNYAKDKNRVYMGGQVIKNADPASYKQLENEFALDKNNVFLREVKIDGADPATFKVLNEFYSKDINNVFFWTYVVKNADPKSFEVIDGRNAQDKNHYFTGENITGSKNKIIDRLKGRIVLKVEENGEAYYINPLNFKILYLGIPSDAFRIMREQGIGINNVNLYKIPVGISNFGVDSDGDGLPDDLEIALGLNQNNPDMDGDGYNDKEELLSGYNPWGAGKQNLDINFSEKQKGKIFLQVERNGEAWYVNPNDGRRYYLGRPDDAFDLMRGLGLGISNSDFNNLSDYTN